MLNIHEKTFKKQVVNAARVLANKYIVMQILAKLFGPGNSCSTLNKNIYININVGRLGKHLLMCLTSWSTFLRKLQFFSLKRDIWLVIM